MVDRAGLKSLYDTNIPDNGIKAIQAVNVREPLKTTVDETILPEDYQTGGLFIPTDVAGESVLFGFEADTLGLDWSEELPPSGSVSVNGTSGVETITIGVQGRYQVSYDIGIEYNETDTIFMEYWVSIAGAPFTRTNAGTLMKFRRNQIDQGTASLNALFDVEPADVPFIIQPRFFSDTKSAGAASVLYANFSLTGWGRTNDGVPGGSRVI